MISISTDLQEEIKSDSQTILPKVKAYMSDRRYMENLSIITSSHSYDKQIMDRKPQVYLKMDKTDYNVYQKTVTSTINNGNPATVTSINHGLVAGTPVLFSSDSAIPANVVFGEFFCAENFFYVQNPSTNQFNLNTSQANAIANSTTGRVSTASGGTNPTVTISLDNPALFTSSNHGFTNGDAITIRTSGSLPTTTADGNAVTLASTTSAQNIFYVQNATTNTFNLNISKPGALDNTNSGRLVTSGSQSGTHTIFPIAYVTYAYNGSHRVIDHGLLGLDMSIGSYDGADRTNVYNNPISPNTIQNLPILNKEILEPKRLIDTFERAVSNTLGFFTSSNTTDTSMGMYSWNTGDNDWSITGISTKKATLNGSGTTPAFIRYNTGCLDHFIDLKFASSTSNGLGAVLRYKDENNFICIYHTGTAFRLVQKCDGYTTTVSTGNAYTFDNTHYYRFEAKYNTFSVYDMGTTEPIVGSTGTALAIDGAATSVYVDDPLFRTPTSTWIGGGNYLGATTGCLIDYAAIESFNYLSSYQDFGGSKYLYATVNHTSGIHTLNKNAKTTLQKLANYSNFTYSCIINSASITTNRGICWYGDKTVSAVYIRTNTSGKIVATITDGTTTYTLTSISTIALNGDTHIALSRDTSFLNLYINGVNEASTAVPSSFTLYKSAVDDICLRVGSGVGSTTTYFNGKIGELAIFDYALTSSDIYAIYKSVANNSTLPIETSDIYFNAEGIVGNYTEETFSWAITNGLNSKGNELKVNGTIYSVGKNYTLDPEYSKFNLATETNNIQSILRENYPWMSRAQSNSSGIFSNVDFIKINFNVIKANKIFISTGYDVGAISSFNLIITLSDLSTLSYVSKTFDFQSYTYVDLGGTYNIISIEIDPISTKNGNDFARIYCVDPIWEVDLSDYVISFDLDKVRENFDASLPIGATAANSGSIVFDNTDMVFNPYGNYLYSNYIYPDTKLFISFDHIISKTQNTENVQLAYEMYADSWSVDNSSMQCNVAFRDYSKFLQEQNIRGYVSQGFSAGRSISDIMLTSGFPKRKIMYIQKFTDIVSLDDPKVFIPFNENYTDWYLNTNFYNNDYCNNVKGVESASNYLPLAKIGTPLVYSDLFTVQDDDQRIANNYEYQIFIPENKIGSYSSYNQINLTKISDNTAWKPISYNNGTAWSFSITHYLANTSYIGYTALNYFIECGYNFSLRFTPVDNNNIYYQFVVRDATTLAQYTITSPNVDIRKSHLIHVVKTVASPNKYELFIDGVSAGTVSPSLTGSQSDQQMTINTNTNSSYVSNFLYYDYSLTSVQIKNHYNAFSVSIVPNYKYLSASETTYWDAMLNIATADLGMFYIDEYGYFRYEYRNILHGTTEDRYQTIQYELSDEENIISGNISTEIQTNKVSVNVSKINTNSNAIAQLWSAPDGESLAITRLTQDLTLNSSAITLENLDDPIWLPSGYVKIDDEIIKYKAIFNNKTLVNLERGAFGTTPAVHISGARAREARFYDAVYTSSPASIANYPFISDQNGIYGSVNTDIDFYYNTSFETQILVSAKDPGKPIYYENNIPYFFKRGDGYSNIVLLQGTDQFTNLSYSFVISGLTISLSQNQDTVSKISSKNDNNIRKFGIKELTLDNQFITNKTYGEIVANYIIDYYSNPIKILNLEVTGIPHLQLGDLINISKFEQLGIVNTKFWVIESKISYDGGIKQNLTLHQYSDTVDDPELAFTQNLNDREYFWLTVAGNI